MAGGARYTLLRKIADGGMAEIFLASQRGAEGFEKTVVLKRILTALSADPQFRNMLLDEAHIAMSLTHSSIVQVLDLGQADGRYFLALEYVDGWNLDQVLKRADAAGTPLPPELALYVTAEVCRALAYAHSKTNRDGKPLGIVHRDISPHNVLVSEQGEVKLADFGIAKAVDRRERSVSGTIKGKIAWMSPEQAKGKELDHRSDLFSVGAMLYRMTTGETPFNAPTDLETFLKVQAAEFRPPEVLRPGLDPAVVRVIKRAMQKEAAERYQSADDMLVDVEQVLRTALRAAGQSELKRWLAALGARDGVPPIGRATAGAGPGEVPQALTLDEVGEPSLELVPMWAEATQAAVSEPRLRGSEVGRLSAVTRAEALGSRPGADGGAWVPPALGAGTGTLAAGAGSGTAVGDAPRPRKRGLGAGTVLLVLVLVAGGMAAAAWMGIVPGWKDGTGTGAAGDAPPGTAAKDKGVAKDKGKGTYARVDGSGRPATAAGGPRTGAPASATAKTSASATAKATADADGDDETDGDEASEETEKSLLAKAVGDVKRAVLGEDDAEDGDGPATATPGRVSTGTPGKTTAGAPRTAAPAPRKDDIVSVKIASAPSGAVVR
ncbi:MAG TPA: serine/threonine-protein kinase [Myxococcota bacterium]|nr:serine/threonine-protein kinase [Myxococcota bacterium]